MNMTSVLTFEERLALAESKSGEDAPCQVIELLTPYVQTRTQDGRAWQLLGDALRQAGRYKEGAEALKKALALSPDRARSAIWCSLGLLCQASISPQEAKPWFDLATRDDSCEGVWVLRGQNHLRLQEYLEAMRCFSHATTLSSEKYDDAVLHLGLAYRAAGDYKKALRCAQQVLRKNPTAAGALRLQDEMAALVPAALETA